jgi:cytochrome oxidase Cu insertion factor (SCO1/SenC/PrrC family)
MARARVAEANKGIGKPLVGGAFHLTDHNGKDFSDADLKGKYSLVYFGFTHCPDICPEELDKMAGMIDAVKEKHGEGVLRNVFISCDPARDTPEVMKRYLAEFHGDILGMTGTWQEVKDVCKAYRVYFSTPADVKPGQDYLVDHSIYFYLMGEFAGCLWGAVCGRFEADFMMIQILRATLLRPLDATSRLRLPRRSSTIISLTGGERSTDHERRAIDVNRDVRLLYTNSLILRCKEPPLGYSNCDVDYKKHERAQIRTTTNDNVSDWIEKIERPSNAKDQSEKRYKHTAH